MPISNITNKSEPTLHLLQTLPMPSVQIGAPECLYFRAYPRECWRASQHALHHSGRASPGSHGLVFNTFFGAFSLTTWCQEIGLDCIAIEIRGHLSGVLRIWQENSFEPRQLLWEGELTDSSAETRVLLQGLKGRRGIAYPEFEVFNPDFSLLSLRYLTPEPPRQAVKLAIIMPTYRRETYVRRNVAALAPLLATHNGAVWLYVVDNGQTLETDLGVPFTRLFANRNYGGAGGFARGVLEAFDAPQQFSHVLFCDDDVVIEPESVERLYHLLGYAEETSVVGGGMLNMGNKQWLHESGAYNHRLRFIAGKHNRDLGEALNVAEYDYPEARNYFAWWFFATSLSAFREHGLPMPFFFRADDSEFGHRLTNQGYRSLTLLGVSVWHDEFQKKDAFIADYYAARNPYIKTLLHEDDFSGFGVVLRTVLTAGRALATYRYDRCRLILDGLEDALKGPEFLRSTDPAQLHIELNRRVTQKLRAIQANEYSGGKFSRPIKPSLIRRLAVALTLNGHLLPPLFFKQAKNALDPGWVIESLQSHRLQAIFRAPVVLYYEPTANQGILVRIDRATFFRLAVRLLGVSWRLLLTHNEMRSAWQGARRQLTSAEFWRRFLGLGETKAEKAEPVQQPELPVRQVV